MNKSTTITAVISAVAGGILGGTITYLVTNKALRTRYEDWANEQIDDVKARYAKLNDDKKQSFIEMAQNPSDEIKLDIQKGRELMERLGYTVAEEDGTIMTQLQHPTARTLDIFNKDDADEMAALGEETEFEEVDDDDYKVIEGKPFLISEEAYFENEQDYELDTLTYYEVDDTLTDEHNERIDRVEETIGVRHLDMFKKNGTAKTSIYIQNDEHNSLYEVILVEESYAEIHLGVSPEALGLKEPKKKLKKMRDDD